MARPGSRWLLMSILLVHLPSSLSSPGPPRFLSPPRCYINCEAYDRVHCEWEPDPDPDPSTNYTLYWKSAHDDKSWQVKASNGYGSISRRDIFGHIELRVWILSENQYGSATSNETLFIISDIMRWPVPKVSGHSAEPDGTLEIQWKSQCGPQLHSEGHCEARHRMNTDHGWPEGEGGYHGHYTIDGTQPYTWYDFQVRCSCQGYCSSMSDWSPVYRVQSAAAAPLGQLDVWQDCGTSSRTSECVPMWKRLSRWQARGRILGYEVKLSYADSRETLVKNVSASQPDQGLKCDSMHCHLVQDDNNWLTGVSAVTVSAYNTCGSTTPTCLTLPVPGTENDKLRLHLKMDFKTMNVSWDPSSQPWDDLKEYVLQYKQAGLPLSQGFDWLRVNDTQTSVTLTGQFQNYTPYQVSLFAISKKGDIHNLSSVIGYALQGVPAKMYSLRVASIESTSVTLSWESIPLFQRKGVILFYQVGVEGHKVHNVSGTQQLENGTFVFVLKQLSPAEDYEVWIRAVSEAGPGANATTRFKTKDQESYGFLMLLLVLVLVCTPCIAVILIWFIEKRRPPAFQCCFEKVPDPGNSQLFYHFKHQLNDSWSWICVPVPVPEPHPEISQVEVVVDHQLQGSIPRLQGQTGEVVVGHPQTDPRLQGQTGEVVVGHPQTHPRLQGQTGEVVGCSPADTEDRRREAVVRKQEWWEGPERRAGIRREDYSQMVDSDEEKEGDEEERHESPNSSEDDESCSGYERHFMPTALEVLTV